MSKVAFVFFHYGKIPVYLREALASVRRSNPDTPILLLCDKPDSVSLPGVEAYPLDDFNSPLLEEFKRSYEHVSCFEEFYERFVLERWFKLELVRERFELDCAVLVDSDVLTFGNVHALIKAAPKKPIAVCGAHPHFTLLQGSCEEFLRYIIRCYADKDNVARGREKAAKAKADGGLWTLGEMTILLDYLDVGSDIGRYSQLCEAGFVCMNLHLDEGFEVRKLRRRDRKKVFWQIEDGKLVPYFRRRDDKALIPAFILHHQGSAKRLITRKHLIEKLPLSLKLRQRFIQMLYNEPLEQA